jgi:transposase
LSAGEQETLERLAKATGERLDRVRRARALLTVAAGAGRATAAQAAGFGSRTSVTNLVVRFNRQGMAVLRIAAGRGRRATYDGTARGRIVALAQEPPRRQEDQTATWSLSTLQRRLRQEPGLARIGTTTIRRMLQEAGSSYQRTRTWCPTGTALRKRKEGVVQVNDPDTEEKKD